MIFTDVLFILLMLLVYMSMTPVIYNDVARGLAKNPNKQSNKRSNKQSNCTFQDSVPDGFFFQDPVLSSVCVCVCKSVCV